MLAKRGVADAQLLQVFLPARVLVKGVEQCNLPGIHDAAFVGGNRFVQPFESGVGVASPGYVGSLAGEYSQNKRGRSLVPG